MEPEKTINSLTGLIKIVGNMKPIKLLQALLFITILIFTVAYLIPHSKKGVTYTTTNSNNTINGDGNSINTNIGK